MSSDITATTIQDTQAASTTFIAVAARPTGAFTLANTQFNATHARSVTVTTTGSADAGKTVTIVGTDYNDKPESQVITSLGSASTVGGPKFFKTITSATCSAQYAANVSVGMSSAGVATFYAGRRRLKAFTIISTGTAGKIDFFSGDPDDGGQLFSTFSSGVDNSSDDVFIPDEGILFKQNLSVYYNTTHSKLLTAFHA